MTVKDTLYASGLPHADFVFDENVAAVFPDMINRSVPGYSTIISMIGTLSAEYARPNSHCYDLGCSLGEATLSMRHQIKEPGCSIISIDNSEAMVAGCRNVMKKDDGSVSVEVRCEDILETAITNASIVVMNFTLQFVAKEARNRLLENIYQGLLPGGLLIMSEKIRFEDPALNTHFIEMHHRFKEQQGYSKLEISGKRAALEKVLFPETLSEHKQRFQTAGFQTFDIWFQCFNFASMAAIKK